MYVKYTLYVTIEQFLSFTLETKDLAVLEFIERPSYKSLQR